MPAPKKPNLIPSEPAPAGPERAAWTMSFDTDVDVEDAPVEPRNVPTNPDENSKVSRRPLAGTRPVAPTRGAQTGRGAQAPAERTRGPAGGMAAEGKQVRLLPGRRVPGTRYRLVRWLGEGGMGVVYEAEHEDIERRVALKILRFEASEPEMPQVFRDEARAASRMGSPNIVEIFDFGELPDGRLFFCMELLDGQGPRQRARQVPDGAGPRIGILRQVCKGLAAAHEVGIIHRDVKPDNIILLAGGVGANQRPGRPRQGRRLRHRHDARAETDTGAAGTPHYMAPEQVLGVAFDGRLDMYSLGCTAYELLVGKPPFVAQTVDEILQAQIEAKPVPPSTELCPPGSVHPALEAVILRCLEKNPENRFRDMHDLEAALCEAQIAAGLRTAWDDLALPPVDVERRDELMRNMPAVDGVTRPRRRWLWPAIAAGSSLFAAGLTAILVLGRTPDVEASAEVDLITNAARAAGARAHWVYPPSDDPNATSYRKVINLEEIDGAAEKLAQERARELRHEFAESLVDLGDDYWEKDGGKPFARDYYLQALNFEPDNAQARERAGATPGMIADFRDKAAQGTFSEAEIRAAAPLIALAEQDEGKREEKLLALADNLAEDPDAAPASSSNSLDRLIRATSHKPAAPRVRKKNPEDEVKVAAVTPPAPSELPAAAIGDPLLDPKPSAPAVKRDTKQSTKLVKDARAALAAGKRKEAESLFHQALGYDNRNASALIGLSDLEFDRGAHQRAADFADKAIAAAPKNGSYHLRLGDAYFKLLKYTDARGAYQKAKDLGVREAEGRLEKLKAKLGK
jgi:tetratricopeptide (TPR) repeat protein